MNAAECQRYSPSKLQSNILNTVKMVIDHSHANNWRVISGSCALAAGACASSAAKAVVVAGYGNPREGIQALYVEHCHALLPAEPWDPAKHIDLVGSLPSLALARALENGVQSHTNPTGSIIKCQHWG